MDKIKKYKRELLYRLITMSIVGILIVVVIIRDTGNPGLTTSLFLTTWIMFYIEYIKLKTKIEILNEIRGEEHNKPN